MCCACDDGSASAISYSFSLLLVELSTAYYVQVWQRCQMLTCKAKNHTGLSQYDDSTESQLLYYNNIRFNTNEQSMNW